MRFGALGVGCDPRMVGVLDRRGENQRCWSRRRLHVVAGSASNASKRRGEAAAMRQAQMQRVSPLGESPPARRVRLLSEAGGCITSSHFLAMSSLKHLIDLRRSGGSESRRPVRPMNGVSAAP